MKVIAALAALSGLASASQYFTVVTARSGSPIHLQSLEANNGRIWIGKTTASFCPASLQKKGGCPPGKNTNFLKGSGGSLYMGSIVQQQVYINPDTGALRYAEAHGAPPSDAYLGGWTLAPGTSFGDLGHKHGLVACPEGADGGAPWKVFVPIPAVASTLPSTCLGFDALTTNQTKPDAYQYD